MHGHQQLPWPSPDLYLSRNKPSVDRPSDYFLDIFTTPMFYVLKKRFSRYVNHFDEGDWQYKTKQDYPALLLACPDLYMEKKLQVYIKDSLDAAGINELTIYTTTTKTLLDPHSNVADIWTKIKLK
jgi:hypothetical protein